MRIQDFLRTRLAPVLLMLSVLWPGGLQASDDELKSASDLKPDWHFTHLTVADGLSDSTMTGVVQDRQGYMWFGTGWGGLNRYDGYEFKVYQHDTKIPRSLSQNNVTVLFLDHLGIVWAGTDGGGLDRYDRDTDDFTLFRPEPGNETSLVSGAVRAISEDASGALWIGTEKGLSRLDRATEKFHNFRHDPNNPRSLSGDAIDSLFCDPETGQLWVGTRTAGVCMLAKGATNFITYRSDPNVPGSISGNRGVSFCKDRSGTFWIGTDQGLNRFVPGSGTFVHYRNDPKDTNSLSGDYIWKIYEDRRGRFWVCTPKGVNLMDRARGTFVHLPYGSEDSRHLLSSSANNICEDNTGAIWFTEVEQGVNRLLAEPPRFTAYRKEIPGQVDGLSHAFVLGIHVDRNDRVWIGTMAGLDFLEDGRPPIRHVHFPENLAPMVQTVAEDGEGGYWAGAFPQGMFHLRGDDVSRLPAKPDDPTRPASDQIWAFVPDPRHGLWIVYWMAGVDYFDGKTFVRYPPDAANPQRLPAGIILSCATDDSGMIWLAGPSGLTRLDPSTAVFTTFQIDPAHPENEVNRSMACVFADRQSPGEIWAGTSLGLYQFDKTSGQFTRHYAKRDGLPSDGVQAIQRDDQGRLWLGTINGLSRFDTKSGSFRNYDVADGLPGKKFFNGAAAKTSDGRLFFGTTKGLVTFDPSRMPDNPYPPPVVLTDFELFNKSVGIGGKSPLRKAITVAEEITLTHLQSVFTFKFAALNFTAPEENLYAYKMEGFDDDWRYTDARRRFATYTRLAPGHYTFRVKASNNDGVWNEQGASIKIVIIPPWWGTWWFRVLATGGLLGVVTTAYRRRVRSIHRRAEELELEVAHRTQSLAERTAQLEAANKELESFSYSVSHDLRTPLRSVDGFSRLLLEDFNDKLDDTGRDYLHRVRAASQRMDHLIGDLLMLSRITRSELNCRAVNLSALATTVANGLQETEPQRRVEWVIPPNLTAQGDARLLQIVLENLFGNAWKFTGKQAMPRIEFGTTERHGMTAFFVRDNGAGFDPAYADNLFGVFQRLHAVADFPGTGIGLATVQRIIHRHGGRIEAESATGQGATFYFTLP